MLALVIPLLLSFFLSFVCALPIVSRFLFICVHLVMNRLFILLLASTAFVSALSPEDVCAKSCQKAIKSFRWSGCEGSRRATCCTSLNIVHTSNKAQSVQPSICLKSTRASPCVSTNIVKTRATDGNLYIPS